MKKWFIGLMALVSSPAFSATDANMTIIGVGSQSGSYGYVIVTPGTSGGCTGGLIYIDITNDTGKGMFSIALTARASGKMVSRIDYTGGSGAVCYATLLQM